MCLGGDRPSFEGDSPSESSESSERSGEAGRTIFTFGGGAWFHAFYSGVGAAVADFSRDRSDPAVRFCGVSAGSLVAANLAFQKDMREVFEVALEAFPKAGRNPMKAVKCAVESVRRVTPEDDECRQLGETRRLLVGVSRPKKLFRMAAHNVHDFRDKEMVVAALSASVHLPVLGGIRGVLLDGVRYFDGQLTQNWSCLPMFDDLDEAVDNVVRVTAYHDESFASLKSGWVTPRFELPKAWQFFPHSVDALHCLWRLGYLRMVEYLLRAEDAHLLSRHFSMPCSSKWQNIETQLEDTIAEILAKSQERRLCYRSACPRRLE